MIKYFKYFVLLIIAFCSFSNVYATPAYNDSYFSPKWSNGTLNYAKTPNGGDIYQYTYPSAEGVGCTEQNSYFNPTIMVDGSSNSVNFEEALIYDITAIDIDENRKMHIYGWAFMKGVDNDLGGVRSTSAADDTLVMFSLSKTKNTPGDKIFDMNYANTGQVSNFSSTNPTLHYYDLTYWNCWKTGQDTDMYLDTHGRKSGGMCLTEESKVLTGGFEAVFDLNTLEQGTYYLSMNVSSNQAKNSDNNKWKDVTAATSVLTSRSKNFSTGENMIAVSGLSDTAVMKAAKGRVMGANGSYCSSPAGNGLKSSTYYTNGATYSVVSSSMTDACKGFCTGSNYSGEQHVYKLKTTTCSTKGCEVKPGSGWEVYAPASWLTFTGQTMIKIGSSQPKEEFVCPSNTQVYNNYYLFLGGLGNSTPYLRTTADATNFNDAEIFSSVGAQSLDYIASNGEVMDINAGNIDDYYTWLNKASKSPSRYYNEGNNYYITHSQWCSVADDGKETCHDSGAAIGGATTNVTIDQQKNASVLAIDYSIKARSNENKTGYKFELYRTFAGGNNNMYPMLTTLSKATPTPAGQYLHPAVYKLTYCVTDSPKCEDTTTEASCTPAATTSSKTKTKKYYLLSQTNQTNFDAIKNGSSTSYVLNTSGNNMNYDDTFGDNYENLEIKKSYKTSFTTAELQEFYEMWNVLMQQNKKYTDGDTTYLTHSSFSDLTTGTTTVSGSNILDVSQAVSATLPASVDITADVNKNGLTLAIKRTFTRNIIPYLGSPYNGNYYNPTIYTVTYSEKTDNTSLNNNNDNFTDQGTTAILHENDRLNTCTLNTANDSGFQVVTPEDTNNNYSNTTYCTVSCKDDIDAQLPTYKNSDAGGYYVLDGTTGKFGSAFPSLTANRTCVTSKIEYNKFIDDEDDAETDMYEKYNDWQDKKDIHDTLSGRITASGTDTCTYTYPCPPCDSTGCSTCSKDYTYSWQEWEIDEHDAVNYSRNDFDGDSGDWESSTPCSGGGETYSSAYSRWKSYYSGLAGIAYNVYDKAKTVYANTLNSYMNCYKWTDKYNGGNNASSLQGATQPTVNSSMFYLFNGENPEFNYTYDDTDSHVVAGVMKEELNESNQLSYYQTKAKYTYWNVGTATNDEYTTGGNDSKTDQNVKLTICTTKTCTQDMGGKTIDVSKNEYIKRVEKKTWNYTLPQVYTLIPNGRVSKTNIEPSILLETNASPININTEAGIYNYTINISNISDNVRDRYDKKKTFEDRFEKTLNSSDGDYTCNYEVINDVVGSDGFHFFYRTVDPVNINPTNRTLGYNWQGDKAETVMQNMENTSVDRNILLDNDHDHYSFTLTPTMMSQIRVYNGTKNTEANGAYADWDLTCVDYGNSQGYHCYSAFLNCLTGDRISCGGRGGLTINLPDTLSYDKGDLDDNRQITINKQNNLDGRS